VEGFVTWQMLATNAGATAATKFLVDAWKALFGLMGKATLYASVLTGIALVIGANLALGECKSVDLPVHAINGLIVGLAASGFNDLVTRAAR